MKILFITRKYPPSIGGMEQFAHDLSQSLATKTKLELVAWGGKGRIRAVLLALPYLSLRAFWTLCRGGVDVIHAQDGVLAPLGYLLSKIFRKPFVVVIHGLDIAYRNPLFKAVVPWSVRQASVVFCISEAAASEVRKHGVADAKVVIIPLAVNDHIHGKATRENLLKELNLPANSKILLTVGRLVKRKGVAWFIENVLPDLVKQYQELVYLVVGEGQERTSIEAATDKAELTEKVHLLGKAADHIYEAAYNGADVFVMPNIDVPGDVEGFGLVVLEASLCELPIVAANIEGIRDAVIDGQNGRLVQSGDAAAFQHTIREFLDDPAVAKRFGQQSRRYTLEHYQWGKIADSYLARYEKLLD